MRVYANVCVCVDGAFVKCLYISTRSVFSIIIGLKIHYIKSKEAKRWCEKYRFPSLVAFFVLFTRGC